MKERRLKIVDPFYPSALIGAINSTIQECMNAESMSPFLSTSVNYLLGLMPHSNFALYPLDAFRCIWYNLLEFQKKNKIYWIKSYWSLMVSYARYTLSMNGTGDNDVSKHKELLKEFLFKVQEFHHMYCAYLLYAGEFSLLKHLMDFSVSSIENSNILIPQEMDDIFEHVIPFDKAFYIHQNYYLFNVQSGVREGDEEFGWLLCFYILCIQYYKIRGNRCGCPGQLLGLKGLIESATKILMMQETGNYWKILFDNEKFRTVFNLTNNDVSSIKDCIERLNDQYQRGRESIVVQNEAFEKLKEDVNDRFLKALTGNNFPVVVNDEINAASSVDTIALPPFSISKDYFTDDKLCGYIGIPESYASLSLRWFSNAYARLFLFCSAIKSYSVTYDEIPSAINKLKLSPDFAIVSLGIDADSLCPAIDKEMPVFYVSNQQSQIVILKKCDCPKFTITENPISMRHSENERNPVEETIYGSINYRVKEYREMIRYIRLNVIYPYYSGRTSMLDKIEPISKYII